MTASHLEATGIGVRFGEVVALDGVDLSVARGELVTLLGPSGCGKTTLLRVIAGFQPASAGRLQVAGRAIDGVPPEGRNFGMVFQNYAIFPHMTVADNVAYGLVARGVKRADIARRVQAALARVQLGPLAGRYPDAMSGGQKQRVGLARAMVIEPELLLMDEPLSNLDALLRIGMRREIRMMQRELGITTIYVTHDQEEALAISDRIAVMRRGRLLQVGTPEQVFEAPTHAFVMDFIGGCNWLEATLDGASVRLAEGAGFTLPTPSSSGPARVALRAEDLRLEGAGPALAGTVAVRSYMGHRTRLHVRLAGGTLVDADVPSAGALPAEGEAVRLVFDPARARVFARAGEDGLDGVRIA